MRTVHTIADLRAQVATWRRAGERVAFVPTMGNLHRGHIHLVERARERAPRTVASAMPANTSGAVVNGGSINVRISRLPAGSSFSAGCQPRQRLVQA